MRCLDCAPEPSPDSPASFTYNVLFIEPVLTFTYSTADDLVPMLALTFGAVGSGLIAGRLRDRALAAEQAREKLAELLQFSQDLQSAVTVADVESVTRAYLGSAHAGVHLLLANGGELEEGSSPPWTLEPAREVWYSGLRQLTFRNSIGLLLRSSERRLGVLLAQSDGLRASPDEISVFLPLIVLAIQRCRLAEQLAESDVLRRSEKFKTAILSSVSHDLRTPLAAISAAAGGLAALASLDEETRADLVATIEEQCSRLDRYTANLLNLGRIESGLDVGHMPVVDAIEVLGGTLARVRRLSGVRTIHRDLAVASAPVRAEESLLEQIFFNVLENAVAHTPADTSIRVTARTDGASLVIAVEDDGPGIPLKDRERIFERFYQIGTGGSGSGLGLSIACGFTELIGGTIAAAAATEPLRGARIEIALPLADAFS